MCERCQKRRGRMWPRWDPRRHQLFRCLCSPCRYYIDQRYRLMTEEAIQVEIEMEIVMARRTAVTEQAEAAHICTGDHPRLQPMAMTPERVAALERLWEPEQ